MARKRYSAEQIIGHLRQAEILITHRLHYTEMVQAYEMAFNREKSMLGVIFQWKD